MMGILGNIISGFAGFFRKKPRKLAETQPKRASSGEEKPALKTKGAEPPTRDDLRKYRKTIKKLREEVQKLREQVKKQGKAANPRKALSGIQIIYNEIKHEKKNVDEEAKQIKSLKNFMESKFLKRKITEEDFRKKMIEYDEKLHILSLEKKELSRQKKDLGSTAKQVPTVIPVSLEQIANTGNLEKLIVSQQKTLERLASRKNQEDQISPTTKKLLAALKEVQVSKKAGIPGSGTGEAARPEKRPPSKSGKTGENKQEENASAAGKGAGRKKGKAEKQENAVPQKETQKEGAPAGAGQAREEGNAGQQAAPKQDQQPAPPKQAQQGDTIHTAMRFTEPMKKIGIYSPGKETQIKLNRIVTDFDQVLAVITENGRVKFGRISKETGITKKRVEECCNLLKDEEQIEVLYPAIGDAIAQTLDYEEKMKVEKEKKKQQQKEKKKGK